jgi:hypothetical protein
VSGFEDYAQELARIDREIFHYAAVCAVDLTDALALQRCLADVHEPRPEDRARDSLRGLLMLRLKVETEMIEGGLQPAPLLRKGEPSGEPQGEPAREAPGHGGGPRDGGAQEGGAKLN